MAKFSFSFLLLFLAIISMATALVPPTPDQKSRSTSRAAAFIEKQCRATHYFKLCVRSLSRFAKSPSSPQTPEQLAQLAIRVSVVRARFAREYISKVAKDLRRRKTKQNYQAVSDCLQQINDGVSQLTNAVKELGKMSLESETYHFSWHQSNILSWLTTAQTEALTCLDGFSGHAMGSRVKATIRAKVLNVVEVTSNALAFFNRYVERHRASHSPIKP